MNDNWRALPITDKLINKIIEMQKQNSSLPPFRGSTRGEAADYIDEHGTPIFEIPNKIL